MPRRGRVGERFLFELNEAVENSVSLDIRATLAQSAGSAFEELAAADPGNAGWQRDLSVSHNKIGDVLTAQGNLAAALAAYPIRPRIESWSGWRWRTWGTPAGSATFR